MTITSPTDQLLLINGTWKRGGSGSPYSHANPWAGHVATRLHGATDQDALEAAAAAAAAFPVWSAVSPGVRRDVLTAAARLIEERANALVSIMRDETGGTEAWCRFNVALAADIFRHTASQAYEASTGDLIPTAAPHKLSLAVRRPLGAVLAIAPWNAPLILGARAIAAPLAFGNTVVFKGSEFSARTHASLVELLVEAGLPVGAVNYLVCDPASSPAITESLISHPAIRHVNFTGSTRVGRVIAQHAATSLKPSLLELGGKAAAIVLADADLDLAADAISFGAFMNSGQICMSTERVIALRPIAGKLGDLLVARAKRLRVGDPADPQTQVGPMISETARSRVMELIDDAIQRGARVLVGGSFVDNLLSPTVIADVTPDMRIYSEESFGPVVTVMAVDSDDEAIASANDTEFGLSSAVFGQDALRAYELAAQIDAGITHVNSATVDDEPQAPFGGTKHSGWGQFGARSGVDAFTRVKWVTLQAGHAHYPI